MPELRVLISSTFRDLQAEHEHLMKKILPQMIRPSVGVADSIVNGDTRYRTESGRGSAAVRRPFSLRTTAKLLDPRIALQRIGVHGDLVVRGDLSGAVTQDANEMGATAIDHLKACADHATKCRYLISQSPSEIDLGRNQTTEIAGGAVAREVYSDAMSPLLL